MVLLVFVNSFFRAALSLETSLQGLQGCCLYQKLCCAWPTLSQALFSWIWTPKGRWCRTSVHVQQVFGAITIARSSIWLHMHRRSKLAKQVGRMMPAFIRAIWWPDAATKREEALDTFLRMQLAALSKPNTQDDCAWLYCWWQHGFRYVGMARARRADACMSGGPLCRFVEHLSLRTRPHPRDAQKLRYRRARSYSGGSFWWLPAFVGRTAQVAAMEQLEIKLHLPNANGPARAGMLDKPCKVQRKRPPRWRRLRCSGRAPPAHAAWEGHIGGSQLTKGMASFESADADLSQWSFCQAYRHTQRCQMGTEATMGPLSIYSPAMQQLFLLWAAAGNEIDWGLLEKCWKVPCGPVALAKLCHMVKGPLRLRRLKGVLDRALLALGLPTTTPCIVPVPVADLLAPVRSQFASVLRQQFPHQIANWCMSRVRFSLCAQPS